MMNKKLYKNIIKNLFCIMIIIFLSMSMKTYNYCEEIESNPLIEIYKKLDSSHIEIIKNLIIANRGKEWGEMIDDTISYVVPRHKYEMSYFDDSEKYVEYKKTYVKNEEKLKKLDSNCLVVDSLIIFLYKNYTNNRVEYNEENGEEVYLYQKMLLNDFIKNIDGAKINEFLNLYKDNHHPYFDFDDYVGSYMDNISFEPKEDEVSNTTFYIENGYSEMLPSDKDIKKKYKDDASLVGELFNSLDIDTYMKLEPLFGNVRWLFKYDYNKLATEYEALSYLVEAYNYIKNDNKF